jgi:hypothetical protein
MPGRTGSEPTVEEMTMPTKSEVTPGEGTSGPPRQVRFSEIAPMMQLADMMAPVAVRVAATLRLADHISSGVTDLSSLAGATEVHTASLRRLMRFLAARGVFTETADGEYALTDLARLLHSEHPANLRARFDLDGPVGRGDLSFIHLRDSIRTGKPSYAKMYGRGFWEDLDDSQELAAEFARMQAANVSQAGIEEAYDWTGVRSVVDVGGGNGALLSGILLANDHVHGTIVDLPNTVHSAKENLAALGLAGRCQTVPGSFFDPLPADADVYLLSKILHDWDDDEAIAILRRCAEAAGSHGKVLIAEVVPAGTEADPAFTYLDLHMLVYFGGKERTLAEFEELAGNAGLTIQRALPANWGNSILECVPR